MKNKARQSCLFQAVLGLIQNRKVQFHAIAEGMKSVGDSVQVKSIEHRLGDFFKEAEFDYTQLALLLVLCLGEKGKIRLCIDRTEWDFGACQVNILMVIACQGSKQVPLYWELLDNKSGNSAGEDRIDLLEKVVALLGVQRIGILIADREFIGHTWLKYLKNKRIHFCIRVPRHHLINRLDGREQSTDDLLQWQSQDQALYLKDCMVDGVWVQVYLKKLADGDILYLIGTITEAKHLGQIYRHRWRIETVFQAFKSRGFDLESSHLKHLPRLQKLIGVVSIAYAFCVSLGIYQHEKVQKIKIKRHGYKEKSFCRVGIELIQDLTKQTIQNFENRLEKFFRYLRIQRNKYLKNNINHSISKT